MHKLLITIFILNIICFSTAFALQIKPVKDNDRVVATISVRELSRIFVSGDRIQSTRGLNGAYELIKDEQQGSIFIKPTSYYGQRAFNLFITTELGHTYNLFFAPKNIPAETIELKPLSPSPYLASRWEKNSPYIETITQLMNFMANDAKPEGYAVIQLEKIKPKRLSNGTTMQLITLYRGTHLRGEIWLLTNPNRQTLHLRLRDFFQDKARAISLENETLHCGDKTYLYRIVDNGR
jgi:type-F conjugative transfer system secretin TraK